MKKVIIMLCCLAAGTGAAFAQSKNSEGKFSFNETTHNYGTVSEGPAAECDFVFTNTGSSPIVITEAHGSCGCTVPTWPKEPIMPGEKSKIHVTYNTKGHPGAIQKDVHITSNAEQKNMTLHITGNVTADTKTASVN